MRRVDDGNLERLQNLAEQRDLSVANRGARMVGVERGVEK